MIRSGAVRACLSLQRYIGGKDFRPHSLCRLPFISEGAKCGLFSTSTVTYSDRATQEPLRDRALRFLGWLGGFYSRKAVLFRSAKTLYENCIDKVDYESFFKACAMPDSFQSWFLVAQLHVWLCLVRLKREGRDGDYMLKQLVTMFWNDVQERMKVLGVNSSRIFNRSLRDLTQEFNGLILAYEEGLLSDDRIMAAAVWRNLIHDKELTDPTQLAQVVEYIRSQVKMMDDGDTERLLRTGHIKLHPLTLPLSVTSNSTL